MTTFAFDPLNRLTQVTDAAGGITRYVYDPKGNLVSVTDAKGQTTTFAYNPVDQLSSTTNPLGQAKTFTYDLARNLTLVVDAQGQRLEFTYDAGNQLVQKVLKDPAGALTDTVAFTYDLLGNLATATDSDSSLTFTYDALGRLIQAATGATIAQPATPIAYTYDLNGNRVSMTDPEGGLTSYAYDPLNRLTTLTSPQGTATFAYDALSRRTALVLPNGAQATSTYDAASQLTRLLNQGPGATPVTLSQFAHTYDAVGNRTTRTTLQGVATYDYDALNRLTQASQPDPIDPLRQVTESFAYDPVGNRTASHLATGQVHDGANRLREDAQFTYTYDGNGNLTSKTARASGARTVYTYSVENQLTRVEQFTVAGGTAPAMTALYRYDPLGRRIAKEVTQAGTTTITRYIYDNEDIVLELDGANTLQSRYTHGPGIDEPLIMLRGGASFFYHADGLGSVWDLTDSTGGVARSYTYDSFGTLLAQPGTVANPYTFTGREVDAETGLYYYRARYYDPAIGRFLQEDPFPARLQVPLTLHLYLYARGNPVRFIDPLGLFNPVKFAAGVVLITGGGVTVFAGGLVIAVAAVEAETIVGAAFVPHTIGVGSAIVLVGLGEIGFGFKLIVDALRESGVAPSREAVCSLPKDPRTLVLPAGLRDEIFNEIGAF